PAIVRDVNLDAEHVDATVVGGIDADLAEVHRARVDVRHLAPRHPRVVRAVGAALGFVLDTGVQDVRVGAVDVHADAAERAFGDALGQLGPRAAGVAGLVHRAAGAAAVEAPGRAPALVGGRVDYLVVGRVHDELGRAGVLVHEEDVNPGEAAVGRLEHAAFLARAPETAERRHVDGVVVDRVHDDAGNVPALAEAHVRPGLAAV